jgi:hypothetical protein
VSAAIGTGSSVAGASTGFTAVNPARLLGTRPTGTTIDNQHTGTGPLQPNTTIELDILGRGTIPTTGVAAIAINITATNITATNTTTPTGTSTYITAYPTGQPRPTEIGPLIGDVMMVYDWCFSQVSESQRSRWLTFADHAVWNVWHPDDANWGGRPAQWSGWSIDNPSNNYYYYFYSFLRATMLLGLGAEGELPSAAGWRTFFRTTKIQNQLVPTFESDLVGGGSREGTGTARR